MKRILLVASLALLLVPAAFAKGVTEAKISGPGLKGEVVLRGGSQALEALVFQGAFFPAIRCCHEPELMLAESPTSNLGPKYAVVYRLPNGTSRPDTIHQDLYPFASGGPVLYTKPGQRYFYADRTRGGWYQAGSSLKQTLVKSGLPAIAPTGNEGDDGFWPLSTALTATLAAALGLALVAAGSIVFMRRRPGAAAAG